MLRKRKKLMVALLAVCISVAPTTMAFAAEKGTSTVETTAKVAATVKATSVKLNKTSLSLNTGATSTLTATVSSTATNKKVTWTSSNSSVATVDSTGKVTAKKAGTATITCKTADGSNKSATCKVTVATAKNAATKIVGSWTNTLAGVTGTAKFTDSTVQLTVGGISTDAHPYTVQSNTYTTCKFAFVLNGQNVTATCTFNANNSKNVNIVIADSANKSLYSGTFTQK